MQGKVKIFQQIAIQTTVFGSVDGENHTSIAQQGGCSPFQLCRDRLQTCLELQNENSVYLTDTPPDICKSTMQLL